MKTVLKIPFLLLLLQIWACKPINDGNVNNTYNQNNQNNSNNINNQNNSNNTNNQNNNSGNNSNNSSGLNNLLNNTNSNCEGDAPPANKNTGVCGGAFKICEKVNGVFNWAEPDYTLIPGYESEEASCDGLDNDCDGQVDEDVCENNCTGDAPPATLNTGVCSGAVKVCKLVDTTYEWLDPDYSMISGYESVETSCDGLDNDCDGQIDEDNVCPPPNNCTGSAPPATLHVGVCSGAVKVCELVNNTSYEWVDPDYSTISGYESVETSCDSKDNDCDGQTDEGGVCGPPNNCTGSAPPATLHVGVCSGAVKVCELVNNTSYEWVDPNYSTIAHYESVEASCDDLDNDCDGQTDEGVCAPPIRWDFNTNGDKEGWTTNNVNDTNHGPVGGLWVVQVPGSDPMFIGPYININASDYRSITINMANDHNPASTSTLQLFWDRTSSSGFNEYDSVRIAVSNSGGWMDYTINLASRSGWRDTITRLRIDPIDSGDGHSVGIDYIVLNP